MAKKNGYFITFEGGEGTGKSTQIARLRTRLEFQGYKVITTREPGGTPEGEKIRALLVERDGGNWTPMAESLLLFAARVMHVNSVIKPALAAGHIVISDRFTDSTRAYQSFGHGMPLESIERLNRLTLDGFTPDLTLILNMPASDGLARSGRRLAAEDSTEDRFENLDIAFHEKLRQGYLDIARRDSGRCRVVDATGSVEDVATAVGKLVDDFLDSRGAGRA